MSLSSTDKGLLTTSNCAAIFIDPQPQMLAALPDPDQKVFLNNLLALAKATTLFDLPLVLCTLKSEALSGDLAAPLAEILPNQRRIVRTGINAWDNTEFVHAVRGCGRSNFLMASLWSEACLLFPALQMLDDGLYVYAVEDASRGTSSTAQATAFRRLEQAGGVSVTALQVLLELQRDGLHRSLDCEVHSILSTHFGLQP